MISQNVLPAGAIMALSSLMLGVPASAGPVTYRITAETQSGLGGGIQAMLSGGDPSHRLALQLGSGTSVPSPSGEHLVPAGLHAGRSLPLTSERSKRGDNGDDAISGSFTKPNSEAKIRLYWGCGEIPTSSQPRILNGAALSARQDIVGADMNAMREWSASDFPSYGEWPNARHSKSLSGSSSLVGDHVVQASYAPELRFTIGADRDFLAPLAVSQTSLSSSAISLSWQPVPRARGYLLTVMGQGRDGTAVIWTSSATPLSTLMASGYFEAAELARLLAARVLLPGDARSCTVPAAVLQDIQGPVLQMTAFGDQGVIAEPKPAVATASWTPAWNVVLRYKSNTILMLGQGANTMPGASTEEKPVEAPQGQPVKRKGLLGTAGRRLLGF